MFLSSRQAGYSDRPQRPKLQGPPEESRRSKRQIFCCRRPNGWLAAHFDWAENVVLFLEFDIITHFSLCFEQRFIYN